MQIPFAEWIVIFAHLALSLGFGFYYDRERAEALANFSSSAAIYRGGPNGR